MYIGEIPEGSPIDIYVSTEDKKISLCTFARVPNNPVDEKLIKDYYKKYQYGSGILADTIEQSGKYVGFRLSENDSVMLKVFCTINKKPYLWTKVKIITAVFKKKTYYLIMSNQNAKETNRRTGFRQSVGSNGIMQLNIGSGSKNIIIKDISPNGIGLVLDIRDEYPKVGEKVQIIYTDKVGNKAGLSREFSFSLKATVARIDDSNHRDRILGCRFDRPDETISQYINMKQIENKKQIKLPPRKK